MNLRPWCPSVGKAVADDDRRRRIGEAALDVVEAQDADDRRHVERAVAERDARRLAQSRRDHVDHGLAACARRRQRHRVDLAFRAPSRRTACRRRPTSSRARSARARRTSIVNPGGSLIVSTRQRRLRARVAHVSDSASAAARRARTRPIRSTVQAHRSSSTARLRVDAPLSQQCDGIHARRRRRAARGDSPSIHAIDRATAAALHLTATVPLPMLALRATPRFDGCAGDSPMNAPDSHRALRPEPSAAAAPGLVAWELIRTLVALRHDEPRIEPRADRLGARLPRGARRRVDADVRRRPAQGEPVRDAARARRQRDHRRHRAVRPHRRRAGRRPAVGHESVRGDADRRPGRTAAASPT